MSKRQEFRAALMWEDNTGSSRSTWGLCIDVSETRGKFQVTEPIPTHRPVYVRVIDLNLEAYGMIRSSSVQGQVEVEFSRPPTHMARFLLNEKL